jgi:hypothetical protein
MRVIPFTQRACILRDPTWVESTWMIGFLLAAHARVRPFPQAVPLTTLLSRAVATTRTWEFELDRVVNQRRLNGVRRSLGIPIIELTIFPARGRRFRLGN